MNKKKHISVHYNQWNTNIFTIFIYSKTKNHTWYDMNTHKFKGVREWERISQVSVMGIKGMRGHKNNTRWDIDDHTGAYKLYTMCDGQWSGKIPKSYNHAWGHIHMDTDGHRRSWMDLYRCKSVYSGAWAQKGDKWESDCTYTRAQGTIKNRVGNMLAHISYRDERRGLRQTMLKERMTAYHGEGRHMRARKTNIKNHSNHSKLTHQNLSRNWKANIKQHYNE